MNIIRTQATELTSIPAIAFKQKLAAGGAGLKLLRLDMDATAVFTLDRRTGDAVSYGPVNAAIFPEEAVREAMELTQGLPYSARGKIAVKGYATEVEAEDVAENQADAIDMVDSEEYQSIVARYSDERGRLNYSLLNKDFIQFAAKSKIVGEMVAARALDQDILCCIVKSRAQYLSGKKESLRDEQVTLLIETLDEIDPQSAFKEVKAYIRRLLAKKS